MTLDELKLHVDNVERLKNEQIDNLHNQIVALDFRVAELESAVEKQSVILAKYLELHKSSVLALESIAKILEGRNI